MLLSLIVLVVGVILSYAFVFAEGETPEVLRFIPLGFSVSPSSQQVSRENDWYATWHGNVSEGKPPVYFYVDWGNGGHFVTYDFQRGDFDMSHRYRYPGYYSQPWLVRDGFPTTISASTSVQNK